MSESVVDCRNLFSTNKYRCVKSRCTSMHTLVVSSDKEPERRSDAQDVKTKRCWEPEGNRAEQPGAAATTRVLSVHLVWPRPCGEATPPLFRGKEFVGTGRNCFGRWNV